MDKGGAFAGPCRVAVWQVTQDLPKWMMAWDTPGQKNLSNMWLMDGFSLGGRPRDARAPAAELGYDILWVLSTGVVLSLPGVRGR